LFYSGYLHADCLDLRPFYTLLPIATCFYACENEAFFTA
jgi:hypothetical protein